MKKHFTTVNYRNITLALLFAAVQLFSGGFQAKAGNSDSTKAILIGHAVLDAKTFSEGPSSGNYIGEGPINGIDVPFFEKQPVQGFSAVIKGSFNNYYGMSDNGFGSIENSADYNLRIYKVKPVFNNFFGKQGEVKVNGFIELHDPDKKIPFPITNEFTEERVLTGADFDIESVQRTRDGFWIGDEFGPFILHVDKNGKVLEAPIPLPDFENEGKELRSPQNPLNEEASAIRVMNAVRTHAQKNGNKKAPVFSPWSVMLADNNELTMVSYRENPPAGSGLKRANSEIFNHKSIQKAGYPVVVWTVNDKEYMKQLIELGVNGIISDRPDLLLEVVQSYDADGDSVPDFLDEDGLIDINKFDAQGHRGGRNVRPENTLPAMEAALDYLMTTLETDCGITKDFAAVLDHDPHIEAAKTRRADGKPYAFENEVLVKDYTLEEIQETYIADKILPGKPAQTNNLDLSPVSVLFAKGKGLMSPYVMPSLQQLFDFVEFYAAYYKNGAGKNHPQAEKRWKNAKRVRFNIETKINPRTDKDVKGDVFAERTFSPEVFVDVIANIIVKNGLQDRADIQSFDFRSLLLTQEKFPEIRTVYLFGDFPKVGESGDGTNLQDQNGENTPWMAGMVWPYRSTKYDADFRVKQSGGFEGMAISKNRRYLYPLLEKPLAGSKERSLLIHEFDIRKKEYTGKQFKYSLDPRGTAIGEFTMFGRGKGLIIERDGTQGDMNGFKRIYEVSFDEDNETLSKKLAVDLLRINDPFGVSGEGQQGDVGIGENFGFPFVTIESVVYKSRRTIMVVNDNNFPFSVGRHVGTGQPDDNEFILLGLKSPLGQSAGCSLKESSLKSATNSDNSAQVNNNEKKVLISTTPNPFENEVNISFELNEKQKVRISVMNTAGNIVKEISNNLLDSGRHEIMWDGTDNAHHVVSPGVYFVIVQADKQQYKNRVIKF